MQGIEQGFYRVVAAAARPEPIRSGLKLGLPLGLQRITYPCLMTPVRDYRNSERAHFCLITGFRYIHPPDRGRLMRADAGVHAHCHLGPCLAGQRDQPVDSCGPAARVALRHLRFCRFLANGQSPSCTALKIRPRSRRTCSSWRRQSTRSQASPSNRGRPSGPFTEVSNVPVSSGISARFASKAHLPTSALFRARWQNRHPGQLYEDHPGGVPGPAAPLSCCLSAARHPLFGHPVLPGNSAPITVGLPHRLRIPAPGMRTHSRFSTFRTRETQTGPGALSTPGTAVFTGHRGVRGRRLPPLCGWFLPPRRSNPARSVEVTKHQQEFPGSRPPVFPLACGHPGWDGGSWAFP